MFEERLKYLKEPSRELLDFKERLLKADGVILVTPEYNGGYPASVKNIVDVFYEEWHRKPIGIVTVSDGDFGGSQVITSLQFSLWKIRAWVINAMFPVPRVKDNYDENGVPKDKEKTAKRTASFIKELEWCMDAKRLKLKAESEK